MPARIRHITIDCREPYALSQFWAQALGFVDEPENPNLPDDPEALIVDPKGHHPGLLFVPVPEGKVVKNRIHLDLQPDEQRDAAVERLLGIGAQIIDDRRQPDGTGWAVLADPEGNEFCVERSAGERGVQRQDTGQRAMPPIHAADERTMLTGMLDWYREGVIAKVRGVLPHHAGGLAFPSATSIAGIVKHLALVEDIWFTVRLEGEPDPSPWAEVDWDADPDWEFHTAVTEPLGDLLDLYLIACERSRAITSAHALDDVGAVERPRSFTLRFVLLHLIEETARHLGHLDILREHFDGTTGE